VRGCGVVWCGDVAWHLCLLSGRCVSVPSLLSVTASTCLLTRTAQFSATSYDYYRPTTTTTITSSRSLVVVVVVVVVVVRPHHSTSCVDATYCYRQSSMVCWSVCCPVWARGNLPFTFPFPPSSTVSFTFHFFPFLLDYLFSYFSIPSLSTRIGLLHFQN